MPPAPLLTLTHVSVSRAATTILHDVSFTLYREEIMHVTGENGAGKSTLLRTIAGLCPLDQGTLQRHSAIGWLGHHNALKLSLTVRENLTLLRSIPSKNLISTLDSLALLPLIDTPVRHLSAGQQRRAAFARVLLSGAPLWLLDEPTTSVDADNCARVDALIAEHCRQGGATILVSHTSSPSPHQRHLMLTPHHTPNTPW